jgi:DNA-binding transcriptional LysR family regulator
MLATLEVCGTLCVGASTTFFECGLFALVVAYQKMHTQISFDVTTSHNRIHLIPGGYDVGFSTEPGMADSTLVCRQLTTLREVAVGSSSYLANSTPIDYPQFLTVRHRIAGSFPEARISLSFSVESALRAPSSTAIRAAANADMGIVSLPVSLVSTDIQAGRLLPVLGPFEVSGKRPRVSPVYAGRNYLVNKIRNFVDFTVGQYRSAQSATLVYATA